jgi:Acyltransferase family
VNTKTGDNEMELSPEINSSQGNNGSKNLPKINSRFEGFDFLRAIFSISIIAYKTKLFYLPTLLVSNRFTHFLSDYLLSGIVGAIAVPVFLQISLFIFDIKSSKVGSRYFLKNRLPRLISLYLFWVSLITAYDIIFIDKNLVAEENFSSLKKMILFVVSGHSTPYFFFFSLIVVTICSEILMFSFKKINQAQKFRLSYFLLIVSCAWVFACSTLDPIISYLGLKSSALDLINNLLKWDYNPLNFLPYVFAAAITSQEYSSGKIKTFNKFINQKLICLFGLAVIFFVLEWILTSNNLLIQVDQAPLDHYMRLSLLFGSWFLLYLSLLFKRKAPDIIKAISSLSLGIYGFHVFFIFKKPLSFDQFTALNNIFKIFPALQILTAFGITFLGSIALALFFGKIKITKKWVM